MASGMVRHKPTVTVKGDVKSMARAQRKSAKKEIMQLKRMTNHTSPEGGSSKVSSLR